MLALQVTSTERLSDKGIFPDLNDKVEIHVPAWVRGRPALLFADTAHDTLTVTIDGRAIATFPAHADRTRCTDRLTLGCFQLSSGNAEALATIADPEATVNPKYVAEYVFPGVITGYFTHLEYIRLAP